MPADLPQRTCAYNSETSVSSVWDRLETRRGDVFICTPPKSGTTWMQAICGMVIFRDAAVNPGIGTVSRWLDSAFNDEDELFACLTAQTHRRYIKTHTPLDGIVHDPGCTYVTVYRHPLDVAFSAQNHLKNMSSDGLNHLIMEDANAGVADWIQAAFSPDQNIGQSLESLVHHYKSYAAWRHLPNIHLFHYRDMQRDLPGAVARLAGILGEDLPPDLIAAIARAASFGNMKANAAKFAPSADRGIWKDNARFFESATSNKWDGILTETVLADYDARMNALLDPADRQWLEWGTTD